MMTYDQDNWQSFLATNTKRMLPLVDASIAVFILKPKKSMVLLARGSDTSISDNG